MASTKWAIEGPDDVALEVNGRKFASGDEGAPMLCSMVCRDLGRHTHIDYCRSEEPDACNGEGLEHITTQCYPEPGTPKDFISHGLHWRRAAFRDPYPQDLRVYFSKCDAMCNGVEHEADVNGVAQPVYCDLPLFHTPLSSNSALPGGTGYISLDGHYFKCKKPVSFHIVFVIDRSFSMVSSDLRPLPDTPVSRKLGILHNNRLGAVYSALYLFWLTLAAGASGDRDSSYSIILFHKDAINVIENDISASPEGLLSSVIQYRPEGWTHFTNAVTRAQEIVVTHWNNDRIPVIVFLSDGECDITDISMRNLCNSAVTQGRTLAFHAISFGPQNESLKEMVRIAADVESSAPPDARQNISLSAYHEASDTIQLAKTFAGIAQSLKKPRGALMREQRRVRFAS